MDRLCRGIVGHPWAVIALVLAATAPFAFYASRVRIDSSVATLVDAADPETAYYEEAKTLFGSEAVDVVAVVADDVFRPATLAKVRDLSARLARIEGVASVASLATVKAIASTPDGAVDVAPLMEAVPADAEASARLRAAVARDPVLAETLASRDGTVATILVTYRDLSDAEFAASGIQPDVERAVREAEGPERIHLTGIPTLKVRAARLLRQDTLRFTPLSALVIVAVLFVAFRSARGVLVPAGATGLGLVWTVGLMGYFDVPIDVATVVLPPLLLAVGSAYATHVVARYYEELEAGGESAEVAFRAVRHLGLPIFITALTTVLGFASLLAYRVWAIRSLGIFSTFGITVLFGLALTFAAAALAVLRVPGAAPATAGPRGARLAPMLDRLVRFDVRRRAAIVAGGALLLAVFGWGSRWVRVDTNYLGYFPEGSPTREAARVVGERLGGAVNFLVVVDGPGAGSVTRLDALQRMAALQDFIGRQPGVGKVTSLVDYVRVLHRAFHDGDPAYLTLPDTDRAVQQYLLMLDPETIAPVASADGSRAALLVRSELHGSRELSDAIARIRDFARGVFPPEYAVHPTGTVVLLNRTADVLTTGQLLSVLVALAVVFVTLSVLFLSLRLGLVAMVPNLIPIVMFFGLLGWAGIPLSISTAVIAAIALGIGVDEAIHFLSEFNVQIRRHADQQRALRETMQSVGPPVVYTTVALSLGFLVPVFSGFVPVRQFAYLSALNVAASLLADVILLPALIASVRFVTLWDVLALKLGQAPTETIPLFHGLRPAEARIATLLGEMRTVGAGEHIVTRGEPGDAMYVLISGQARVESGRDGRRVALRTVGRGDVVGEMGLVRRQPRSADVIADDPTEVLVVDERFLRVLRRRYPRIAATVLYNLTRILSDRMQSVTERLVAAEGGAGDEGVRVETAR